MNIFYRVKKGDDLFSVSKFFNLPISVIIKDNNLCEDISDGDLLVINRDEIKTYVVKPLESSSIIAQKFCVDEKVLLEKNGVDYFFPFQTIMI